MSPQHTHMQYVICEARVPSVMRLLNSIVEFCLVYGIDETSTRELDILEEGVSLSVWLG